MKKRLFTTVLAVTMALAVNATAFAAENTGNYSEDYSKYTSDWSASVVKDSELSWGNWGSGNGFDWNKDENKHPGIGNVGSSECIWRVPTAGFAEQNGRNAKLNSR